jgi:two-component system alkaline phosphatase synthesis response regulator PhoP
MRILFVEDEENIRKVVKANLEMEGYEVISTDQGEEAIMLSRSQHFDLIILDIMLPDISGLDICEQIRLENFDIPIIFVSAKDTSQDRIAGLKKGADDYLTKPFALEELLLRVNKLFKRSKSSLESNLKYAYTFGKNSVNLKTFEANNGYEQIKLTKKEVKLLKLFLERENEVISRKQILQSVWGYDVYPSTRTIDNFILSFRKYFEEDPKNPVFFHSVRGIGYQFTVPS